MERDVAEIFEQTESQRTMRRLFLEAAEFSRYYRFDLEFRILRMKTVKGMSIREIAIVENLKPTQVRYRYKKIATLLREFLLRNRSLEVYSCFESQEDMKLRLR